MWKRLFNFERFFLSFKSAVQNECFMSFTDKLFKFSLLLFKTCPAILNTRSLAALLPISQSVFLARSLRAGNSNLCSCPPLKNISTPLHHKLSAALKFLLMSLSHVLDQHSVTCTKNFLSHTNKNRRSQQKTCWREKERHTNFAHFLSKLLSNIQGIGKCLHLRSSNNAHNAGFYISLKHWLSDMVEHAPPKLVDSRSGHTEDLKNGTSGLLRIGGWVGVSKRFTRGAAIDSLPMQRSLRKQPRGP